jgi:hypothetical protein
MHHNIDSELKKIADHLRLEPGTNAKNRLDQKLAELVKPKRLVPDWFWGVAASISILLIAFWTIYLSSDGLSSLYGYKNEPYIISELNPNIKEGIYTSQNIFILNEAYSNSGL